MRKLTKWLGMLLAIIMLMSSAGFSFAEEETVTIDFTSLGLMAWEDSFKEFKETEVYAELVRQTGVEINFIGLDGEQSQVRIASGELGDIVQIVGDATMYQTMIDNGQLANMDELVDTYAPSIRENVPTALEWAAKLSDGVAYTIPGNVGSEGYTFTTSRYPYLVRWDLYKELGYPAIENEDDYLQVVADMIALQPETANGRKVYGATFCVPDGGLMWINGFMQSRDAVHNLSGQYLSHDYINDKFVYEYTDEDSPTWKGLKYFNKAYNMGILDPDSFTQLEADIDAKVSSGEILCTMMYASKGDTFINNVLAEDPESEVFFAYIPVEGIRIWQNAQCPSGWGLAFSHSIAASSEKKEAAMRWLEYIFSPEGSRLLASGIEGEHWVYNEDGVPVFTQKVMDAFAAGESTPFGIGSFMTNFMGIGAGELLDDGSPVNLRMSDAYFAAQEMTPGQKDYCEYYGAGYPTGVLKNCVDAGTMVDSSIQPVEIDLGMPTEEISRIDATLKDIMWKAIPKIVTAATDEEFEAAKAETIEALNKKGAEESRAFWQARFDESHG